MAQKKILMIVGDYAEDYEVMVPFQFLLGIGHEVVAVCPGKSKGQKIQTAIHDFEGEQTYSEKKGHLFELNADFEKVVPKDYDALVLPGGRAPEYLRLYPKVIECVRHFFDEQKPVAAICHGIQLLTAAKVLSGYRLTAYPTVGPEVDLSGASFVPTGFEEAIVDRNLVTAPGWPAHPKWLSLFLSLLGTKVIC
ncbi:protease [Candidatus Methylacidiphilum fumarolicum]|uniref:Protease n=2 Tax=Candidatus Methylacidiphilum fumarolicum TaxID=591154 RepID=A0ABN8XCI7_9BACT|nr:DJ-1/PfpI family protein [Candidatus Methylacidiphilum fumarolicum]MBW6414268.1 DJ-1/PfpI family protein [Candidatus Methylacidiphilum fumarolicum]TFE70957.1 protease [Candidatus Methylacidiphilum fumarolicum]TFE71376.1 protease [Candidatus Methylacidiphilum fumarolicum]TFE74418.1 protease [Candidatus Methylacidiphilum fumarolicum]TFE76844.1 protease [Candidatus Methylacidiphilum fumarolicum]